MADKRSDYPYIAAWGEMLGWPNLSIGQQIRLAHDEHAPANAAFRRADGTWATTEDITSRTTRQLLGLDLSHDRRR